MPDLRIAVENAEAVHFAAVPQLAFKLRVANEPEGELIHTVALKAQIQLEVTRRQYSANEQAGLRDLFGEPDRWGKTLRNPCERHCAALQWQDADRSARPMHV
jgi:hypothetical protein